MARTQAFDWFSTFLLAALILLVPILFVIWVNPRLLDRLQEEFAGRPAQVRSPDASGQTPNASGEPSTDESDAGPARDGAEPAPEASPPSDENFISAPGGAAADLAEARTDASGTRTAAKPVATEEADAAAEGQATDDPAPVAAGAVDPAPVAAGAVDPSPAAASSVDRAPVAAGAVDPTENSSTEAPISTAPGSLAVPPALGPAAPSDPDGDGDAGGLRPIDEKPKLGTPTPAIPPVAPTEGVDSGTDAASAEAAEPAPAAATENPGPVAAATDSDEVRHEEILREIRSLVTAQRALEGQFSALRRDIDGRLSVLKSAVDDVATNGSSASRPGSTPASTGASAAEQARADRAAKILRATLDGKLTLELGDESGTKIDFVYVPPGRFRMGRTAAENQAALASSVAAPAQEIIVDRGFFVSKYEVSDEQFVAFLRSNYSDDPKLDAVIKARDDLDRPAANVTWALAKYFCLWASEESAFDVRLPTEIEWEYAARGPYGVLRPDSVSTDPTAAAGDSGLTSGPKARDVGEDSTDRSWCGAVDFWGNVAEWCADVYDPQTYALDDAEGAKVYSPAPAPADWLALEAAGRSVRGGSFADPVETRDLSERRQAKPGVAAATLGFRVVLVPDFDGEPEVGQAP